jgi:hypothetical protein
MRRMLEWRIEIDHHWSVKLGMYGRGLKHLLPSNIWAEFASTYDSLDVEETRAALDRVIVLFRQIAPMWATGFAIRIRNRWAIR